LAIRLKQVRVRSGDRIAFVEGITVIVGPNNVGKSLLLKEINEVLSDSHGSPLSRTKMLSECKYSVIPWSYSSASLVVGVWRR